MVFRAWASSDKTKLLVGGSENCSLTTKRNAYSGVSTCKRRMVRASFTSSQGRLQRHWQFHEGFLFRRCGIEAICVRRRTSSNTAVLMVLSGALDFIICINLNSNKDVWSRIKYNAVIDTCELTHNAFSFPYYTLLFVNYDWFCGDSHISQGEK